MDDVRSRLDELGRLETVSAFSQFYCELVAARLDAEGLECAGLERAFATHLERELRYHLRLRNFSEGYRVHVGDRASLEDKRDVALHDTVDVLESMPTAGESLEATRRLMLAECCYHLSLFDRVVAHLEAAIGLGADDPLIHFALGHNRFVLAEQVFTIAEEETGGRFVFDPRNYRATLLEAVSAFERGLTGGVMDRHLYWWIGTCLEQAGFEAAAQDAFSHADGVTGEPDAADVSLVEGQHSDVTREALPRISTEEVRRAGELLKRPYSVTDVLGDDELQ